MKIWSSLLTFVAITLGMSASVTLHTYAQRGPGRFYCGTYKGNPATIANYPRLGNVVLFVWKTTDFGPQYPPRKRCEIISGRFQRANQNGTLNYIVEGRTQNGYSVLCASRSPVWIINPCPNSQILLTLRRGIDDPKYMIGKLAQMNSDVSTVDPLKHSAAILEESGDGRFVRLNVPRMLFYSESDYFYSESERQLSSRDKVQEIASNLTVLIFRSNLSASESRSGISGSGCIIAKNNNYSIS